MKRFWWSLVIFLGFLTYFMVGNSNIFPDRMMDNINSLEASVHYELNQRINVGGYYTGSNARLRPTNTTSEAKTLYEQARTNLAAR